MVVIPAGACQEPWQGSFSRRHGFYFFGCREGCAMQSKLHMWRQSVLLYTQQSYFAAFCAFSSFRPCRPPPVFHYTVLLFVVSSPPSPFQARDCFHINGCCFARYQSCPSCCSPPIALGGKQRHSVERSRPATLVLWPLGPRRICHGLGSGELILHTARSLVWDGRRWRSSRAAQSRAAGCSNSYCALYAFFAIFVAHPV